jgi:hypothetical protein
MDTTQVINLLNRTFEAFNQRDWETFRSMYSENAIVETVQLGPDSALIGPGGAAAHAQNWTAMMSNAEIRDLQIVQLVNSNLFACHFTGRGDNDGSIILPNGKVQPSTGSHVELGFLSMIQVNDAGKITHEWFHFDMDAFVRQLGLPLA